MNLVYHNLVGDLVKTIAVGSTLAILALFAVGPYRVDGNSMEPAYSHGDFVVIDKLSFKFRRPQSGEVVVFVSPWDGRDYIKRIVKEVGPDKFWLEGDNKEVSTDSRDFGPIDFTSILGRAMW